VLAPAGQAYTNVHATVGAPNYTAANGQLLSPLGTVVPATLGPSNDLFFLSFDQIGTHVHAYVDPTPPGTSPAAPTTPQPDLGVATFERLNHSFSRITGVAITDSAVNTLYQVSQQSMPAGPLLAAFGPSQQAAISQLANTYCREMMASQMLRDKFFGAGIEASLGQSAGVLVGAGGATLRQTIEQSLVANALGNANPQTASAVTGELETLLQRIQSLNGSATVSDAAVAACTAVLGSAAVTLQ